VTIEPKRPETISVVIAAYNAAQFLHRAVRSALEQTYPILELIIVDDASTDDTRAVAEALGREDQRVKLIALPVNGGPARARNAGFAAAKGDWIAVLDADDAFLPDRISNMMRVSSGVDILADNFRFYDAQSQSIGRIRARRTKGFEDIGLLSFTNVRKNFQDYKPLFRRHFLDQKDIHYPDGLRHGEDLFILLLALSRGALLRITWEPGYLYTTRGSGWSRTLVDYRGISRSIRELSKRSDLDLSPAIRVKLEERARHLDAQDVREQVKLALRERRPMEALALVKRHPAVWKLAWEKLARRVRAS
jgi:succinoglycan biosynthesis protein ExoO